MKLAFLTQSYGERICVTVSYNQRIYFKGKQPLENTLVVVDLPRLSEYSMEAILRWLKNNTDGFSFFSRREINEFPETSWRKMILDDIMEVYNYSDMMWHLRNHFSLQEFKDFGEKWSSFVQQKIQTALEAEVGNLQIVALEKIDHYLRRVYYTLYQSPYRLNFEVEKIRTDVEQAAFDKIRKETTDISKWIEKANYFRSSVAINNSLEEIAKEIAVRRLNSEEVIALISNFSYSLQKYSSYPQHPFWIKIAPLITLTQNTKGEKFDISDAKEEKVFMGWDVLEAKRVGAVTNNRNALVIRDKHNLPKVYIKGERKLKFQIQQKGGIINKFGCTLTINDDNRSIQPALLEVEKIDSLANLNINEALQKISHLNLPENHLVYKTAEKAKTDFRQSRVLADLIIELLIGIDADVARSLARAQAKGNRR